MSRRRVSGVMKVVRKLRLCVEHLCKRSAKNGVDIATKAIVKDARARVPVETRLLKRSLGRKVKTYQRRTVAVGIVGVRKHMKGPKGQRVRSGKWQAASKTRTGREVVRDPIKYGHMVERGTRPHRLHKGASLDVRRKAGRETAKFEAAGLFEHHPMHPGAKPKPFLRPAFDKNRRFGAVMARVIKAAIRLVRRK